MSAMPRLVKPSAPPAGFTREQWAAIEARIEAERAGREQAWRDVVQAFGAVFAAMRRLAGDK